MKIRFIAFIAALSLAIASCKHEPSVALDELLFDESQNEAPINFRNGDLLDAKGGSPHGSFKLRMNALAAQVLDSSGKVPANASFPNGALIVKDVIKNGKVDLIAIMKKDSTHGFEGERWLWAEYKPNGNVYYGVSRRGVGCTGCHSTAPSSDFTRVFDLH